MSDKLTGQELHDRAAELDIEGRSSMTADELRAAIAEVEAPASKRSNYFTEYRDRRRQLLREG